jgi:hypothetical protein
VTAIVDLLSDRDREQLAELRGLVKLMEERGGLPPAPIPPPLHRMNRDTTTEERTTP